MKIIVFKWKVASQNHILSETPFSLCNWPYEIQGFRTEMNVVYSSLVRGQVKKLYFIDADTGAKSSDMPQETQTLNMSYN